MFGGGWGRLAARGEGSGGGDGRVTLVWSPLFLSPTDDFQVPQLSAKKCMLFCGPLAFYARRTQGLNRIFGLAFFIEHKDLRYDPGKATLMLLCSMCKPPQDLAHRNKKRHLFLGGKSVFCVFVLEKKTPVDMTPSRVIPLPMVGSKVST
jgi:hypothetical protein